MIRKIFISLILLIAAFLFFSIPKSYQKSSVISEKPEITIVEQTDGIKTFCSAIAYFLLVLTGWLWKKELGINQLGIFGSSDIEPQVPRKDEPRQEKDYINIEKEFLCDKFDQRKKEILEIAKKYNGIINVQKVAHELRITTKNAEILLWALVKENKLRKDTYGYKSVYSLRDSLENKAIDKIVSIISSQHEIIADNRQLLFQKKFKFDAMVTTVKFIAIIEIKEVKNAIFDQVLERWFNQISNFPEIIDGKPIVTYLAVIVQDEKSKRLIDEKLQKYRKVINNLKVFIFERQELSLM